MSDITVTYRVRRVRSGHHETTIASGIATLAEAAEVALRLTELQEQEFGSNVDFYAEPD